MNKLAVILILTASFLGACATPFIGKFSVQAARRQARQDYAAGTPKIYRAGSRASYEPGISESQRQLVAGLPRDGSMVGCVNPQVQYSKDFATAYNQEIISLLQKTR